MRPVLISIFMTVYMGAHAQTDTHSADSIANNEITVVGVAQNAKAGAVLLTEKQGIYYLEGYSYWKKKKLGKPVTITGSLRVIKLPPTEIKSGKDEWAQATIEAKNLLKVSTMSVPNRHLKKHHP